MLVAAVSRDEGFGDPQVLFEDRCAKHPGGITNYDATKDGQSFLMVTDTTPSELRVTTNWFDELQRLVPTP